MTVNLPAPAAVGERAAQILTAIEEHPLYRRLKQSSTKYTDCWGTFTGYPLISEWDLQKDAEPLFTEAMRVLALKTAVYELTVGDEHAAELECSAPVDEMVHAVLVQYTLCQQLTASLGITFVHMTDQERFNYRHDGYTDRCYAAAGWGAQDRRYWIDLDEMALVSASSASGTPRSGSSPPGGATTSTSPQRRQTCALQLGPAGQFHGEHSAHRFHHLSLREALTCERLGRAECLVNA